MPHEVIAFPDRAGHQVPGWLFKPKAGSGIGVVMIHDIHGLRDDYENVAAPFVAHGYTVLIPDMFHDVDPIEIVDQDTGAKRMAYIGQSSDARHWDIMLAAVNKLKAMPESGGRIGLVGYCLGGTICFLAAARLDSIGAAAGYYATRAHNHLDEAKNIRRPLILHLSETDRTHKPEDDAKVCKALDGTKLGRWYVYPGTVHGFANNDHIRYDAGATAIANARTFALFDQIR